MNSTVIERRVNARFELRLPLRYRVCLKGQPPYIGTGLTQDLSLHGIAFRCRRSLPVGAHIELLVDWPTKFADLYPIELHVTGFVMRSTNGKTAIRMTSHRLRVSDQPAQPVRASA
jgi:hypothetical protein